MTKLHLIMPMGGNGSRFTHSGFNLPKPLIPIYGKPFFYWATMSIMKFNEILDLTFVVLKEHIDQFAIDNRIHEFFPEAKIVVLEKVLNGPVLTCLRGIEDIADSYPLLFNDCDHLFKSDEFNEACKLDKISQMNGGLITFHSNLPQYSYVKFDKNDEVIGTIEKVVASDNAICGAYIFKNEDLFKKIADMYLVNCSYKEFFVSGMYNEMAKLDGKIGIFSTDYHVPFGIPEEYELALKDEHYKELE